MSSGCLPGNKRCWWKSCKLSSRIGCDWSDVDSWRFRLIGSRKLFIDSSIDFRLWYVLMPIGVPGGASSKISDSRLSDRDVIDRSSTTPVDDVGPLWSPLLFVAAAISSAKLLFGSLSGSLDSLIVPLQPTNVLLCLKYTELFVWWIYKKFLFVT